MTSMKSVMLDDDGRSAGAETNMPADVADKRRKKPPARLKINTIEHMHKRIHGSRHVKSWEEPE